MRSAIEFESKEKAGWVECFRPQHRQLYRTLLCTSFVSHHDITPLTGGWRCAGMSLQMFQQLTGANYFFYVSGPPSHRRHRHESCAHRVSRTSMVLQSSYRSASATPSSFKSSWAPSTSAAHSEACTSWRRFVAFASVKIPHGSLTSP